MSTYETELDMVEASRQELAKAEKLFNLPITMYPELLNVQKEMKGLRQIYEIYKNQKVRMAVHYINFDLCSEQLWHQCVYIHQEAKAEWSQTLWVNLDIKLLQEGIEGLIKSLRKLPKDVRTLPVSFFLEGRMKEFKESVPLLLDLKNEALRDR